MKNKTKGRIHPKNDPEKWAELFRLSASKRRIGRPMSTMKNPTRETQVFHGDYDPHFFGDLVKNPTAEEWAEAVRVYVGNPDGEEFAVAIKRRSEVFQEDDGADLTLLHLGDFGVEPGSKYLVEDPTAEQWARAISNYLAPAMRGNAPFGVARRWDDNLSLFGHEFDIVEPGERHTAGQAQSEIDSGMLRDPDEAVEAV